MTYAIKVTKDHGHPWTGEKGWDLLEARADNEGVLDKLIAAAEQKFWDTWIRDNTGNISVVMYKPTGAKRKWHDVPKYNGKEASIVWD